MSSKLSSGGSLIISAWNMWSKPKYRCLLFKNYCLKILHKTPLDFNDLIFPWKNSRQEVVSQRYYHAFTDREFKEIIKKSGLKINSNFKNRYNYWYILNK